MMFVKLSRLPAAFLFSLLLSVSARAQLAEHPQNSFDERSGAFQSVFETAEEDALNLFRFQLLPSFGASELAQLQTVDGHNYALENQLASLDLFRSLAAYYRELPFAAQSNIDRVVSNAPPASRTSTNAALLSALEFYAHSPLRRTDVETGLARLNQIVDVGAAAARVQAEIYFWKAEGYRGLGDFARSEVEYVHALDKSGDVRLTALTQLRLGELDERINKLAEAETHYTAVTKIPQSPIMLLAYLRLGGVLRAVKKYSDVLKIADAAESLYDKTPHLLRTSARDLHYSSPLVEELMLHATEHDRILSTAPEDSPDDSTAAQLVSPFYLSELALLRGSALSELGQYAHATDILTKGDDLIDGMRDSARAGALVAEQARFISDALRFERGWSLFQREKYQEAAAAFLQLGLSDTNSNRHALLQQNTLRLREQGLYFDPFLNDSLQTMRPPALSGAVLSKMTLDTSLFLYNDFAERARYYAGVALARAGMLDEAAEALVKLSQNKGMLYSDLATYQLALIRFAEQSYEASKLLEPVSYDENVRGAYASFLLGELAYRRNQYERAEAYFLRSFANLPANDTGTRAAAHLERGLSLIPMGNWSEAADELHTYLSLAKETTPGRTDVALFWLGKSYLRSGQFDSARSTFEQLFIRFPKSELLVDVQYAYAWSLFQDNDFSQAEQAFEKVIALDSISRYAYDALARAGDAQYAIGEYRKANLLYNQAVDRPAFNDFRTTRALMMLGLARMKIDSTRSALNEFTFLANKYTKSDIVDQALFNQAVAAYAINQTSVGEQTVERIATQYSKSGTAPRALYLAGEERLRRNDPRGASTYYQRVVNNYPGSPQTGPALVSLQDALAEQKRIPEALAVADTFIARNPESSLNPLILIRAAEFQIKLKQPASAIASAQSFLKKYPEHPQRSRAELLLGEAQLANGDTALGLAQLTKIITEYDTVDVAAQAYLERARFERTKRQYDAAASDFKAASADRYYSSDASPIAMFEYGQMLAEQKKTDSAISVLTELAMRYPIEASLPARAAIRASELLIATNHAKEGRDLLQRVIVAHNKDLLAGAAAVRIGESYVDIQSWKSAATTLVAAKQNYSLTAESDARRLLALARAYVGLEKKADAIRQLHTLAELRGAPSDIRSTGSALLTELQPAPKAKAKKGRHK